MANKIQIRRGQFSGLPHLDLGEPALTTDTGQVYFGGAAGNIELKTAPPSADRTIYVATTALGGQTVATQGATGLELSSGTSSATVASKLVDSSASFTAALVNKTLYNKTDDTWAKVIAVDSPTQLSLSADIMASGEQYAIASAIDNIPEAFLRLPDGYVSNITLRISPGAFADDVTFIGKNAGGNFSLSVRGSTTGTTAISGKVDIRQRLALRNLTFTNKIRDFFGADVSWYTCVTSGASKLYVYSGSANYFEGSTIVFGNDPGSYVAVSSTITKGYTMYVASSTLGGDDAVADGLQMYSGSATSMTANKLVDSSANFGTDVVGKTVYNSVDDTWAKITARDSSTQLSLSADIMASGEAYVIANAFSTVQASVNAVPGAFNCNTLIKACNATFAENIDIGGKSPTGTFKLTIEGTLNRLTSLLTASSATTTTIVKTGAGWTVNAYQRKRVRITSGTGAGQIAIIKSNTADTITIVGQWAYTTGDTSGAGVTPDGTSIFIVEDWLTIINPASLHPFQILDGQKAVFLKSLKTQGTTHAKSGSSIEIFGCWLYSSTASGITFIGRNIAAETATLKCYSSLFSDAGSWGVQYIDSSTGFMGGCLIYNSYQYNLIVTSSFIKFLSGGSDKTTTGHGLYADRNGVITLGFGAASAMCSDNAGAWGAYADSGAQIFSAGSGFNTFTGNASGTYGYNAAKFAYAA